MKFSAKVVTVLVALLLATSAFAAGDTHKGTLQVFDPVQINGKQLPAGQYDVKWEGNGPNVQVSIERGKKVMATVPAHVVDLQDKAPSDTSIVNRNDDGSRSLTQIRFGGKKYALSIGEESAQNTGTK
jgi:hypothetical protein